MLQEVLLLLSFYFHIFESIKNYNCIHHAIGGRLPFFVRHPLLKFFVFSFVGNYPMPMEKKLRKTSPEIKVVVFPMTFI